MRRAAFFDMDRTLVRVNTATLYLRWRVGRRETSLRQAARATSWLVQYAFGIVDAPAVTGRALEDLRGVEEERFRQDCQLWYAEMVQQHITDEARREVDRRRQQGSLCVILTASTPYATFPLAEDLGIEHVLCTQLEVEQGRFTGSFREPLCYGHGKVAHAETWARQHEVALAQSAFYTDSVSDLPMLERVGEPRVVNPDPRLRLNAARRGWPVERWT